MEMNQQMAFPETFEGFAKEYGFKDEKEVYTNGSDLISIFRVKQWLEQDNKLRTIEIDAAYERGKHANKWIPVSERLPEKTGKYLVTVKNGNVYAGVFDEYSGQFQCAATAWMPLPDPYQSDESVERS